MPLPIIVLTGLAMALSLVTGGYGQMKPSLFIAAVSAGAMFLFLICLKKNARQPDAIRMLAIAVCLPLLAWSLPSVWWLFAIMCLWVPLAAGRFRLVVPVYLFSLLLLPGLDYALVLGPLKLFEFNVHNGLAVGAAAAVFASSRKAQCRPDWDVVAFSVVFLIALALVRGTSMSHHIRMLIKVMLDLGLPYYIVSRGLRERSDLRAAMHWLAAGGVLIAAILLFEVSKGWPVYNELYWSYNLSTELLVKERGGMLRAGGPFVESTSAAMLLALCIIALYLGRDNFRGRAFHYLILGISVAGLVAPQSRGAWVGLCFAVAVADLLRGRYLQLAGKTVICGALISGVMIGAKVSPYLSEQLGMSGGSRDTVNYRELLFDRGIEEFVKQPVYGYSIPELNVSLSDLVQGEGIIDFVNTYIWIMLISGLMGLAIFLGAFVYFLMQIAVAGRFKGRRRRDVEPGVFVFAALAMSMEMFFFTSFGTRPASFLFVLYGFAAAFIRLQAPASQVSRPPAIEPRGGTAMLTSHH